VKPVDVELSKITKSYQEGNRRRPIFSDLSALFPSGNFSVILGASGSGKTTLLNLVGGIDLPDSGSVHIGGTDISRLNDRDRTLFRRHKIGFVFQFFNLIPTLTVLENVTLIPRLDGIPSSRMDSRAEEILTRIGLGEMLDKLPERLSGGEQQRVALARTIVQNPEVILADEPTGNLDKKTGGMVLQMMIDLIRSEGKTLIMATHSRDAAAMADRLFTFDNGDLKTGANKS
jgi:putative ABC transport system ATP-binding protein